jgi:hypothetical protein
MRLKSFAIAVLIGLLGSGGTAYARDFCFSVGTATLVAKGFTPPRPNKCKPFKGAYFNTVAGATSGSACTNAAGNTLRVGFSLESGLGSLVGQLTIPYPSLTGGTYRYEFSNAPNSVQTFSGPASGAPCATTIPIP